VKKKGAALEKNMGKVGKTSDSFSQIGKTHGAKRSDSIGNALDFMGKVRWEQNDWVRVMESRQKGQS
jgi:hypothetical protein